MGVPNIKELIAKAQKEIPYEAPSACVNCDEFKKKDYGLQFLIVDQDGKPIAGREYFIGLDDASLTGRTDAEGKTEVVRKNKADKIAIHVLFEAPNRLIKREDVMPADGAAETSGVKQSRFITDTVLEPVNGGAVQLREVVVDDKAATRQAIILALRQRGIVFETRSDWKALPPTEGREPKPDWNYHSITLHHAGNSFSCGADGVEQLRKAEAIDIKSFGHISYHYAIDCQGIIYEALDVREMGAHIRSGNTGAIGIVLLEDLSEPGEAWEHEYAEKKIIDSTGKTRWERFKNSISNIKNITTDGIDVSHDKPSTIQAESLTALVDVLRSVFAIRKLGGHREFQRIATGEGRACPGKGGMALVESLRKSTGLVKP